MQPLTGSLHRKGGGQRSGPCSELRLLVSVVVRTTETSGNSKALIYPPQTAPAAAQRRLSSIRNVVLRPRAEAQSPAVLCPVTVGIQKRTSSGGPTPHSDAPRRLRRNAVRRLVVSRSTFMQRRTRRHHKEDPDAHRHTCSHVQAAEHLKMQARTQKLTHTLPEATERVEMKGFLPGVVACPPAEAVLSDLYHVSSLVVHISSASGSRVCPNSAAAVRAIPPSPRFASALPLAVQVSAKSLQRPPQQQSWHHPHRRRCLCRPTTRQRHQRQIGDRYPAEKRSAINE